MTGLEWLLLAALIGVGGMGQYYKDRAQRAEEWVWYIQSEIDRLVEEDRESEA